MYCTQIEKDCLDISQYTENYLGVTIHTQILHFLKHNTSEFKNIKHMNTLAYVSDVVQNMCGKIDNIFEINTSNLPY